MILIILVFVDTLGAFGFCGAGRFFLLRVISIVIVIFTSGLLSAPPDSCYNTLKHRVIQLTFYTKIQCIICACFTLVFRVSLCYIWLSRNNTAFVAATQPKNGGVRVPVKYKLDILPALKAAGYNTTRLRREKLLAESTIQQLRNGELVSWANIGRLCGLLNCQPGDLLEYVED
mgnify:CR=1